MALHISKLSKRNILQTAFTVVLVGSVAIVTGLAINKYQDRQIVEQRQQSAILAESAKVQRQASEKITRQQATISKLYSVCMDAQESFDKLTAKERVGKTRPDCTVAE